MIHIRHFHGSGRIRNPHVLQKSVALLGQCIESSQASNPNTLQTVVNSLIYRHQDILRQHYKLPEDDFVRDRIWKALSSGDDPVLRTRDDKALAKRAQVLKVSGNSLPTHSDSYNRFIRLLYPLKTPSTLELSVDPSKKLIDLPSNYKKYDSVNHSLIFKAYCEIPSPQPLHIEHHHLEEFLTKFLYNKSDFIRPNFISESSLDGTVQSKTVFRAFNEMLAKRSDHQRMVSKVLNDLKKAGLPLTLSEQTNLIYLTFYRDKKVVVDKVHAAISNLGYEDSASKLAEYNLYDFKVYESLKKSIFDSPKDMCIDTYNVLLFHAIRHNQPEVVRDILKELHLEHLLDSTQRDSEIYANSRTYYLLLEYFSSQEFSKTNGNSYSAISATIQEIVESQTTLDIVLINKVIATLCEVRLDGLAESLIGQLLKPSQLDSEDSESVVYKLLTPEDKRYYRKLLSAYNNLKTIAGHNETFQITPTEGTFRPFIKQICNPRSQQSFQRLNNILRYMEDEFKLPITTRLAKIILNRFIETVESESWSLDNLIDITSNIIRVHDSVYNLTRDTAISGTPKAFKVELSSKLQKFVDTHLQQRLPMNIPKNRGTFLKLSDDIVDRIYRAFISTVNRQIRLCSDEKEVQRLRAVLQQVQVQNSKLQEHLNFVRGNKAKFYDNYATKQDIYNSDEITYIKKGYLIDLVDLVQDN